MFIVLVRACVRVLSLETYARRADERQTAADGGLLESAIDGTSGRDPGWRMLDAAFLSDYSIALSGNSGNSALKLEVGANRVFFR